jgi:hypothetical protein
MHILIWNSNNGLSYQITTSDKINEVLSADVSGKQE